MVEDPTLGLVDHDGDFRIDLMQCFGQFQDHVLANPNLKVVPSLPGKVAVIDFPGRFDAETFLECFHSKGVVVPSSRACEQHIDHDSVQLGFVGDFDPPLNVGVLIRRGPRAEAASFVGLAVRHPFVAIRDAAAKWDRACGNCRRRSGFSIRVDERRRRTP